MSNKYKYNIWKDFTEDRQLFFSMLTSIVRRIKCNNLIKYNETNLFTCFFSNTGSEKEEEQNSNFQEQSNRVESDKHTSNIPLFARLDSRKIKDEIIHKISQRDREELEGDLVSFNSKYKYSIDQKSDYIGDSEYIFRVKEKYFGRGSHFRIKLYQNQVNNVKNE